jgi:hypothetical protein
MKQYADTRDYVMRDPDAHITVALVRHIARRARTTLPMETAMLADPRVNRKIHDLWIGCCVAWLHLVLSTELHDGHIGGAARVNCG